MGALCAPLESYIQLKPGPGFSLEMHTFERREAALRGLCYIQFEPLRVNVETAVLSITRGDFKTQRLPIDTACCKKKKKKKLGGNKVRMFNVFNDSYTYIFQAYNFKSLSIWGLHDCRGGGGPMNECWWESEAQQSRRLLLKCINLDR